MRSHAGLALTVIALCLCTASCGTDDESEVTPGADASADTSQEAGSDATSPPDAAQEGSSLPDAAADSPLADSPPDGPVEVAAEDVAPDALADLKMSFQPATGYGVSGWNADGTGPEPAKTGYAIPQPYAACMPAGQAVAFAYVASADHDGILSGCPGSVQGNPATPPTGFDAFVAQLGASGKSLPDLAIRFAPVVLESPASFPGSPEHRTYKGGTYVFHLGGEPMVAAQCDTVEMIVDYKIGNDCSDDVIEATTSALTVTDASGSSSAAVKSAATAFLADVAGRKVQLHFVGFQALAALSGTVDGRTGATFSVGGGAELQLAP